jgi:outer membrane protein assembly factor BamB
MIDTRQFANEPKPELLGVDGTLKPNSILQKRYRITGVLGVGGMGSVYQARDLQFPEVERFVAVKEMLNLATDPQVRAGMLQNFAREANLLATLAHPAIPTIHDYFPINDRAYLVMEYINGKDLEAILNSVSDHLPVEMVMRWAMELCDVLSYLHQQNPPIIFRDMKPANVMIDTFGRLRLIDFGIAKAFQQGKKGTMIGTEGYSAPEQYKGEPSPSSDIYGIGATIHHLITLQDPRLEAPFTFADRPIRAVNPNVSVELEAVVMKALAYNIKDRFPSAEAMKKAIEKALRPTPEMIVVTSSGEQRVAKSETELWQDPDNMGIETRWKFKAEEEIRSTPVVHRGILFIGSYDNNLHAVNLETGQFKWKYATDGGIATSPAIAHEENLVVIGSDDFSLHAVDIRSGRISWTFPTQAPVRSSPTVAHGHVFFGSDDGKFYAVRSATGRAAWRFDAGTEVRSKPLVLEDLIIVGGESGDVVALDLSGQPKWRFKAKRSVMCHPFFYDGLVYVTSMDWHIYALDIKSGWSTWKVRTQKPIVSSPTLAGTNIIFGGVDGYVYALDAGSGRERWKFHVGNQVTSSPTVYEGNVYVGGIDGKLYCIDAKTGRERWAFKTGGPIPGSPVIIDGIVYFGSTDHYVYALKA